MYADWAGLGFSCSAENVAFTIEGEANVPVLRADLDNGEGGREWRDINLAERIQNDNGSFLFV
jgi:hypothetical protein